MKDEKFNSAKGNDEINYEELTKKYKEEEINYLNLKKKWRKKKINIKKLFYN